MELGGAGDSHMQRPTAINDHPMPRRDLDQAQQPIFGQMSSAADLLSRITTDPHICHGKAVVRGMRWPVQNILQLMASGMSTEDIIRDHPELEPDDFLACLAFAAKITEVKSIHRAAQ